MKLRSIILLLLTCLFSMGGAIFAQNAPVDFEVGGNGADWTWIVAENGTDPALSILANPVSGGINTTATVAMFTAELAGQPWALFHSEGIGEFTFDATNSTVKLMVNKPVISNVGLKFEGVGPVLELTVPNTLINEWEELTFDFSSLIGNTYNKIVVIPDFDFTPRAQDNIVYLDNVTFSEQIIIPDPGPYAPVDFEVAGHGADWDWIVAENGTNPALSILANPVSGGINTSATVAMFTAELAGQPWALFHSEGIGEFTFDATNSTVKLMVNKPVISNVGLKFEGVGPVLELTVPNTLINEWEELTFDFSSLIGNTYNKIVVIPDFDFTPRAQDNIVYLDNVTFSEQIIIPDPGPYAPVDFEVAGHGADWDWIVAENGTNPALSILANPVSGGINTSATVAMFTAELAGQPWALFHSEGIGEFTFDATNSTVKLMVNKPVISNVGLKFEGVGPVLELTVPNTLINEWEELTFDFSSLIGNTYNKIVVIPDFDFTPRAQDNIVYLDNVTFSEQMTGPVPGLFFSEYAEGSAGNNKYVEIYNPTGVDVDLTPYSVQGSNNGGPWGADGNRDVSLSGTLAAGEVYVIAADQANADILAQTDLALPYESPVHYNGNDGVALLKDGLIIDAIGEADVDPANPWDVAGVVGATQDHTLIRKNDVMYGNIGDWAMSAGTDSLSSQWLIADAPTGEYTPATLGWHIAPPPAPMPVGGAWTLANEAGALMVGPNPNDGSWWSNSAEDVITRACLFDDKYVFYPNGGFGNVLDGDTWLEQWQGVEADICGAPVAPHDGMTPATFSVDLATQTVTLNGVGAYLGIPKAFTGGELTNPAEAPASITYELAFSDSGRVMTVVVNIGGGFWTYKMVPTEMPPPPPMPIAGAWVMAPEAGALMVGPNPNDGSWWSNSAEDVITRACLFDDKYVFYPNGGFGNVLDGDTWLEQWQGVEADICGAPVAPHDGMTPATFSVDLEARTVTLHGVGSYLGIPKVITGGEISNPADAPESITYDITFSDSGRVMTALVDIGGGFWTFKMVPAMLPPPHPMVAAPTPDIEALEVFSIFSDAYVDLAETNFNPDWGQSTQVMMEDIEGNNTLKYGQLNYQGTNLGGADGIDQDVTGYDFIHLDYWTANAPALNFFLISRTTGEQAFSLPIVPGEWASVDIPLSHFIDLGMGLTDIFQFKVDGGDGETMVWLDNWFFHDLNQVGIDDNMIPDEFALSQNYPNPFNPSTTINYSIVESGHVTLKLYNITGQEVVTLIDGEAAPGFYSTNFDASHLATGTYFYALTAGNERSVKKMVLIK